LAVYCYLIPLFAFGVRLGVPFGTVPLWWLIDFSRFVLPVTSPGLLFIVELVFFVPGGPYGLLGPRLPPVVGHGIFERVAICSFLLTTHPRVFATISGVTKLVAFSLALGKQ
jgi:hypothetical protein